MLHNSLYKATSSCLGLRPEQLPCSDSTLDSKLFDFNRCVDAYASGLDVSRAVDYTEFLAVSEKLFTGIPVPVRVVDYQPYSDVHDMAERVHNEGVLYISSLHPPPYWSLDVTIQTRAVHDWFAHILPYNDFSWEGEVAAYKHTVTLYPPHLSWLLYSEIVLQVPQLIKYGGVQQKVICCHEGEPLRTYEAWSRLQGNLKDTHAAQKEYRHYVLDFLDRAEMRLQLPF